MKQLTEGQRYELQAYLQAGIKKDEIAHLLGIHRSTLYRELCRNKWNPTDSYDADYAQYRYERRKEQRIRPKKFTMCVKARAEAMLVQLNYSPEHSHLHYGQEPAHEDLPLQICHNTPSAPGSLPEKETALPPSDKYLYL